MQYSLAAAFALTLMFLGPRNALAQGGGSVNGFGALPISELSSSRASFGGTAAINLVPGVQAIGELGRMGNVLPAITDNLISLTPLDVRVSAFYGEGGVRFSASRLPVTPYVEATVGIARLDFGVAGLGTTADVLANGALGFLGRTEPIAGVGGGLRVQGGPLLLDLGYRYKQILANDRLGTILGAGQDLHSHQLRVGVGVRF
jgi:hypothetical protein